MANQENWRPVVGYQGLYEVSDHGRVRSLPRDVARRGCGIRHYPGQLLTPQFVKGYPRVVLKDQGRNRGSEIHKLVIEAFVGPCPPGREVRHYDGDKLNCTLGNLIYGTRVENEADKKRHGTDNAGERQGSSRLTANEVLTIREMRGAVRQRELARMFGVGRDVISRIHNGKAWRHLLPNPDAFEPRRSRGG